MSMIIEMGDSGADTDSVSIRGAEDPSLPLNDRASSRDASANVLDESEESDSDTSYTHIDNIDDADIGSSGFAVLDNQQLNHELEADPEISDQSHQEGDLCSSIPGMYRILDLISERGTSGLVDKIIIAQDSLKRFLNEISPGSYISLTKVDFKALDKSQVKPIGIYGSKDEIVRFLVSIAVIDDILATKLIGLPEASEKKQALRSGLYICHTPDSVHAAERAYVIYWPEESTWDDDTSPSMRRNRITFMRYLTKICDQVIALISDDHAKSIVWNDSADNDQHSEDDEDDTDRFFTFEVAKTKEQEEGVSTRKGFECTSDELVVAEMHPECNEDSELFKPRLLFGETRQGFMTTKYMPVRCFSKPYNSFKISAFALRDSLLKERLQISEAISCKSLSHLVRLGLGKRFSNECDAWEEGIRAVKSLYKRVEVQQESGKVELNEIDSSIRVAVVEAVFSSYPTLDRSQSVALASAPTPNEKSRPIVMHPRIADKLAEEIHRASCNIISDGGFKRSKERIQLILYLSNKLVKRTNTQLSKLIQSVYKGNKRQLHATLATILREIATSAQRPPRPTSADMRKAEQMVRDGENTPSLASDPDFISDLEDLSSTVPGLQDAITTAKDQAQEYLRGLVDKLSGSISGFSRQIQQENIHAQVRGEQDRHMEPDLRAVGLPLVQKINSLSESFNSPHTLRLRAVMACKDSGYRRDKYQGSFEVSGYRETWKEASILFTIHLMHLTREDQHELQLNHNKVPNPRFKESYSFQLSVGFSVSHAQLLERDRLFLVLTDRYTNLHLYLDHLNSIESSIGRERGKMLHRDKIGEKFLLAFDESQAMLVVISCEKLLLHVFVHDDSHGFTASGSTVNLIPWYCEGTTIQKACFASGTEELLLIDSQAVARVFSLTTMQFRPASLDLHLVPVDVHSSPDGSCFLIVTSDGTSTSIVAYHWNTFGSSDGFPLHITDWASDSKLTISSLVRRGSVYLLKLDLSTRTCSSVALDITRKVTEFMFREKNSDGSSRDAHATVHNSVIDCHADVWAHFPVVPAIQRATISSGNRSRNSILFVTNRDHTRYAAYFNHMVETFERTSKKPTGDKLGMLRVSATTFDDFLACFSSNGEWNDISRFKVGEWIVDILCLIPIHLALARDNRFVPLKDGVYSTAVEKSLLGAEINDIVNMMSFGWYESIFQSYMADKPVRVVSSMGEQSVGKSFALNHLVDTSFAGSAMRTTEGVWMSVTPTKDALIVALDFEGVHSIERSAQEDTLLVLFNTAISNLVLFRNNFALSRDIAGLFQSFQSSSSILDPVANPSLFQSTLIIIIKDVVESDTKEITREFTLKFQQIVEQEQDANFITRLHGGNLNIVPWPVIESKDFYKLFHKLKRNLDQQQVTHKAAGEFLHLMKTLMAKLKANDWGALSQTMAAHRAKLLLTLLPTALAFGMQDVEHDKEPLRNLDSDIPIDSPDSEARLFVANLDHSQKMTHEEVLDALFIGWDKFNSRQLVPDAQWAEGLAQYLEDLAEMRINHVREWVRSNLTRFQAGHASVMELQRALESAVIDLMSNMQLCGAQCTSCQLHCIRNRFHDSSHDCKTKHVCTQSCEYCVEAGEPTARGEKICVMIAGHSGKHICKVNLHLCGAPCKLRGRSGCLEACAKVVDHIDDDHQCAADTHACGEPCALSSVRLPNGSKYNCKGRCRISIDVEHETHQCGVQYCPISCQLCKRLCLSLNHLHVLEQNAIHLCGEPHVCTRRCDAEGICEIEMTPDSIEETFKGMHERFQYTKYSQNARRLKCVKYIPPGQLSHDGPHAHSLDPSAIHYCQERCAGCQYYCTRKIGHPGGEHDTSHGSMSNVRWTVDAPDEEGVEVDGRRYATSDEGAPMMCSLVCKSLDRHVHVDYCRAETPGECRGNNEVQHIAKKMRPNPDLPKDYLTHNLFWKRSGFKDPYLHDERANFTMCDSMCPGSEHAASGGRPAAPSFCTLPLFHAPANIPPRQGHISADGHQFMCKNPESAQQTFHIIYLIDRSKSMAKTDEVPSHTTPAGRKIRSHMYNRLGAVYDALHYFWTTRQATCGLKHDANTIILHADDPEVVCEHDTESSPNELLDRLLSSYPQGGNSFDKALKAAETAILECSDETRPPVIIFLSDGIASVSDGIIHKLFKKTAQKGKGLSLHAILFGPKATSTRMERMVDVARDAQNRTPLLTSAPSSFHEAPDRDELLKAFLGIAASLRKPRAALMR